MCFFARPFFSFDDLENLILLMVDQCYNNINANVNINNSGVIILQNVERLMDVYDELVKAEQKVNSAAAILIDKKDSSTDLFSNAYFQLELVLLDEMGAKDEGKHGSFTHVDCCPYFQAYRKDELDREQLLDELRAVIFNVWQSIKNSEIRVEE